MKILSFTHPQVFANLYEFLSSAEHKGRYFKERLEPLTSIVEKKIQCCPTNVWFQLFFKISFFCVQYKKEFHTGLQQFEGE